MSKQNQEVKYGRRPSDNRVTFRAHIWAITGKNADKYGHTAGEHIAK